MVILIEPKAPPLDLLRSWNVFFSDGERPGWLARLLLARGFRHVEAAAYFADQERWVFVVPSRRRMAVHVMREEESAGVYAAMVERASVVLRFDGRAARVEMPAVCGCVGAVKALLGIRARAFTPFGLFRHLLREGAETIHVKHDVDAATAGGRSESRSYAAARSAAREAGTHPRDAGSTPGRDPASQPA